MLPMVVLLIVVVEEVTTKVTSITAKAYCKRRQGYNQFVHTTNLRIKSTLIDTKYTHMPLTNTQLSWSMGSDFVAWSSDTLSSTPP